MCFFLAMFQQLSGINSVIFYSTTIFKVGDFGVAPNVGSAIVMTVNMVSACAAIFVSRFGGRRTVMLITQTGMVICLVGVWFCQTKGWDVSGLILVNVYIIFFELGTGSILWPYLADVCNDKGMSIGVVNCWFWSLAIALTSD